jgi:hypothetical protein
MADLKQFLTHQATNIEPYFKATVYPGEEDAVQNLWLRCTISGVSRDFTLREFERVHNVHIGMALETRNVDRYYLCVSGLLPLLARMTMAQNFAEDIGVSPERVSLIDEAEAQCMTALYKAPAGKFPSHGKVAISDAGAGSQDVTVHAVRVESGRLTLQCIARSSKPVRFPCLPALPALFALFALPVLPALPALDACSICKPVLLCADWRLHADGRPVGIGCHLACCGRRHPPPGVPGG